MEIVIKEQVLHTPLWSNLEWSLWLKVNAVGCFLQRNSVAGVLGMPLSCSASLPSCEELLWGCAALGTHKVSYKAICFYKFFYSGSISPLCGAPADSPAWCVPASLQAGEDGWNIVHFWGCVTDWLWWGRFGGHLPQNQPCISWSVNVWECPRGWRWGKGWESLKCAQMRALTQEVGLGRRGGVEEWGAPGHWGLWIHVGTKFNPKITFKVCGSLVRPIFH